MGKSFVKELREELENIRAGRSIVELDEDRMAQLPEQCRGLVQVNVSKTVFNRLVKLAKRQSIPVTERIEKLVKKG